MAKKNNPKIVYYQDPVNDEFANNPTHPFQISDDFKYIHENVFYRTFAFILYHIIAKPIFYLILKIKHHVKVYNKKAIKQLKNIGFFTYTNHTQNYIDAFINPTLLFRAKGHIIAHNDVYSLKGLRTIVSMLGTLPTPNNMVQSKKLFDAVNYYIAKKHVISIFPEAHVWPYYNGIRPFTDVSFIFPATANKPIIVTTVVYRQRKILKNRFPYISLHVSNPIYPNNALSIKENQQYLRDEAYRIMKEITNKYQSYSYIKYEQKV